MVGLRGWLEESASINGYSMSVHMSAPAIGICSLAGKLAFWHCTTFHQGLAFTVGQRGRGFSTFQSAPWDIAPESRYCSGLVDIEPFPLLLLLSRRDRMRRCILHDKVRNLGTPRRG